MKKSISNLIESNKQDLFTFSNLVKKEATLKMYDDNSTFIDQGYINQSLNDYTDGLIKSLPLSLTDEEREEIENALIDYSIELR